MAGACPVQLGARLVRCRAGARRRQQGPLRALDRRCGDGPGDQAHLRPAEDPLEPGRQLSAPAGPEARRSSAARPQQRGAAVGDHAGRHEAGRRGDPRDDAAHRRGTGRSRRARPRPHDRGRPGPGREMRRPVARWRGVRDDQRREDRRLGAARRCLQLLGRFQAGRSDQRRRSSPALFHLGHDRQAQAGAAQPSQLSGGRACRRCTGWVCSPATCT